VATTARSLGLVLLVFFAAQLARAEAPAVRTLPVMLHVAELDAKPVASDEFIAQRIERANQIYAPYKLAFSVVGRKPLAAAHAHLETRADRDALGAEVGKGVIDCFIVESLRDVDEPTSMRRGVHWHSAAFPGAHYVILSTLGGPDVLAHELGHYLGNPNHSETPGNLMSYQRTDAPPFLDAVQLGRLERALRRYLSTRELKLLRSSRVQGTR
jgi:hypothetical protein